MMNRSMKDSGNKWIGKIPENWEILKLKRLGSFYSAGVDKKIRKGEKLYTSVHYTDVYYNSLSQLRNSEDYLVISAKEQKAKDATLLRGDVLLTTSSETPDDIGHSSVIEEDLRSTLMGYHLMRFRPNVELSLEYEKYIFGSDYLRGWFSYRANGITRYGIKSSDIKDAPFLKVPIGEQQKIASFLDEKVSHIDNIIEDTKKSIVNMKIYKQSLITETVSKGLNPNIEMKDSGIDWIGKVPSHYQVIKYKYLLTINSGRSLTNSELDDDLQFPVYGGGKVVGYSDQHNVDHDNILLGRVGANCGNVTKLSGKTWATDNALIIQSTLNKDYLFYLLVASNLNKLNTSSAQPLITGSKVLNFKVPLAPKMEQQQIVKYLDVNTEEVDKLIDSKENIIEELESYKKSLIYEYVTGKKEVK